MEIKIDKKIYRTIIVKNLFQYINFILGQFIIPFIIILMAWQISPELNRILLRIEIALVCIHFLIWSIGITICDIINKRLERLLKNETRKMDDNKN